MAYVGKQAVVIGGSIAGLMAARVATDHFEAVTVIERDALPAAPAPRRAVPQGAHAHSLLLAGEQVMSRLYPGFTASLRAAGAVPVRAGRDVLYHLPQGLAYSPGGSMLQPRDLGFDVYSASRELIEHCVREHTQQIPHVRFETATVTGLSRQRHDRIELRCENGAGLFTRAADLVVDASGRGSLSAQWLQAAGWPAVEQTQLGIDIAYASARYRLPTDRAPAVPQVLYRGPVPQTRRTGLLTRIEHDQWLVTLVGRLGEVPPADETGLLAFASGLPTPALHELLSAGERLSPISTYRVPLSLRRHYERLPALPLNWLAVGDAICSFNPLYGQGMSVAALQVLALQELLRVRTASDPPAALQGLVRDYFQRASGAIDGAWALAARQDLAFPETRGVRPPDLAERARYGAALEAMIPEDPQLHRLLAEVFNLTRPVSALDAPALRERVRQRLAGTPR
ncbi:MAG: FAD-dependent oxidoreductase [Hylemonella sp.]|uniref:FAD-dependent oxidoreductase n=1 Tax=Hylemonella sp. TaxID=2066020 RepID=UPI003919675F